MKIRFLFVGITLALLPTDTTRAIDAKESYISQHCGTIQQSLRSLQKSDIHTRAYLGGTYQKLLKSFVIPLNVNLIVANKPNQDLIRIQGKIDDIRQKFADQFTDYSHSLEELFTTDCYGDAPLFYSRLLSLRAKRGELAFYAINLRDLFNTYYQAVKLLVTPS